MKYFSELIAQFLENDVELPLPCNHEGRTKEMHSCPFAEDINNDSEPMCHCCEDCEYECALDI